MADPAAVETGEDQRRRRNETLGLEMLSRLEAQGRDILDTAAALESEETGHTFAAYRTFRAKLGEFESFCNVIETQIRRIAGERRGELDDLFRKRRAVIFRPAIRALNAFFSRLANGGPLPFGLSDVLHLELNAIEDIREIVTSPGAFAEDDAAAIGAEIERLETTIKSLGDRATGFIDFAAPLANEASAG